jgi:hypothetical protein
MLLKDLKEKFPFISIVLYGGNEYVGIIINQDQAITSMYVFTLIRTNQEKLDFLEAGNTWWWESNRMIPISIFLREEMHSYHYSIINMNSKDVQVTSGPCVNLNNLAIKRVKRKSVQLVRKPKS